MRLISEQIEEDIEILADVIKLYQNDIRLQRIYNNFKQYRVALLGQLESSDHMFL